MLVTKLTRKQDYDQCIYLYAYKHINRVCLYAVRRDLEAYMRSCLYAVLGDFERFICGVSESVYASNFVLN